MSTKHESAFPGEEIEGDQVRPTHGLTKREYAAIAAMRGMLTTGHGSMKEVVRSSVAHADALFEELDKNEKP